MKDSDNPARRTGKGYNYAEFGSALESWEPRPANFAHWRRFPHWELQQGILLFQGWEDPPSPGALMMGYPDQPKVDAYQQMQNLAVACVGAGTLMTATTEKDPLCRQVRPAEFIRWAVSMGFECPPELADLAAAEPEKATTDPLKKTERATLLRIVLGMAMAKFEYDPKSERNPATGTNARSICAALDSFGLAVDPKTVRKYLKEAAELFRDELP